MTYDDDENVEQMSKYQEENRDEAQGEADQEEEEEEEEKTRRDKYDVEKPRSSRADE